jgi:hypothetical protein
LLRQSLLRRRVKLGERQGGETRTAASGLPLACRHLAFSMLERWVGNGR